LSEPAADAASRGASLPGERPHWCGFGQTSAPAARLIGGNALTGRHNQLSADSFAERRMVARLKEGRSTMNPVTRVLSLVGLAVAGMFASAPVEAGADVGVTLYGGGRHHGYAISLRDSDRHYDRGYRVRYYDARPAYRSHASHPYGYYGFNGGYYGVYDGNSYENVFARAYDDGYSDGFNAVGHQRAGGERAYRRGYDLGYRDGLRDSRNAPRRYRDR
jgi:hypothetical protein